MGLLSWTAAPSAAVHRNVRQINAIDNTNHVLIEYVLNMNGWAG